MLKFRTIKSDLFMKQFPKCYLYSIRGGVEVQDAKTCESKLSIKYLYFLTLVTSQSTVLSSTTEHTIANASRIGQKVGTLAIKKPILYGDEISPPVRFVLMTASILKIDLDFHKIDLFKRENRSQFYKEINPLQKVPTLTVKDTSICDSHAIAIYLCQLANDCCLYPTEPIERAKINQILFFNSSTLFRIDSELMTKYFAGQWPTTDSAIEQWYSALDFLEILLCKNNWLAGEKMYLCDVCAVAVVTSMMSLVPLTQRHSRVHQWIKSFESLPFYNINKKGLSSLNKYIENN